ncbi:hypothetical protein [Pollutibacter soli]|uniref:hypothetical protein n=1 Tax=Pollutibacter soli TaxID=3034157 RepID=UPI0030139AAB
MRTIVSISVMLFIITSCSYASPVYFSFQGFKGKYYIDKYQPVYNAPSSGSDTLFDLPAGTHTFGVDDPFAKVDFTIDAGGKISKVSNNIAATAIDTVVNGVQCSKLIFHTSKIFIDASSASFILSAHNNPYPTYQNGNKYYYLIKGFSYYIASDLSALTIPGLNYPGNTIPTLFWFSVDEKGNVQPKDSTIVNLLAARYKKNKLIFNTIPVKINLKDYRANEITIKGHPPIKKDSKLYFIRGLGTLLEYKVDNVDFDFYLIPM